jgi:hypothetical protein
MRNRIYPASRKSYYYDVEIYPRWKDLAEAWAASDDKGERIGKHRIAAFAQLTDEDGKFLGRLHFHASADAGLVSHEVTHAALNWLRKNRMTLPANEEDLCYAVQQMTTQALKILGK